MAQSVITPRAPSSDEDDILDHIPKADATYRHLGTVLIPHTRIPNMFLLEYQTFSGAMAYQPCSRDIDLRGFFEAFEPVEQGGDPLFKVARAWCCIVQSIGGLPKEIRWVLATIFNFCNEMMRPGTSEDTFWAMRQWLLYWLDVAEALLYKYDYPIYAPRMDWFLRPKAVSEEDDQAFESNHDDAHLSPDSVSSDGDKTVVRHKVESGPQNSGTRDRHVGFSPGISRWIAAQPDWAAAYGQSFDPAPGGRTMSGPRPSASAREPYRREPALRPFRMNPEAAEFEPNPELITSPESMTSRSASRTSADTIEGFATSSEMDELSCSERRMSSTEHLHFMIEAYGEDAAL